MQFGCAEAAGIRAWIAPAAAMMLIAMAQGAAAQGALPPGFVYLRDVEPSIVQDMRYAGSDNFVGRPLPGYEASECILRRDVAAALKRVQADLSASGLSLKVYDCYRPMRAVRAMVQWVNDGRAEAPTKRFFPKLRKVSLNSMSLDKLPDELALLTQISSLGLSFNRLSDIDVLARMPSLLGIDVVCSGPDGMGSKISERFYAQRST